MELKQVKVASPTLFINVSYALLELIRHRHEALAVIPAVTVLTVAPSGPYGSGNERQGLLGSALRFTRRCKRREMKKVHTREHQVSVPAPRKDIILAVKHIDTNHLGDLVVKSRSLAALRQSPNKKHDQLELPSSPVSPTSPTLPELAMNGGSLFGTSPNNSSSPTPVNNNSYLTPVQNGASRRIASSDYTKLPSSASNGASSPATNGQHASNGEVQHTLTSPPILSPTADQAQWSSAVGHATTGGKSGRVIEKLMSDNDRLKRELREQITRAEELQRNMEMYKPRIEALESENENLSHARSVDHALLGRRDRQLADAREELAAEKERREKTEQLAQKLSGERDSAIHDKDREVSEHKERRLQVENENDVLKTTIRQTKKMYESRVSAQKHRIEKELEPEVKRLQKVLEEDKATLLKLDVVHEQQHQEIERGKALQAEMVAKWEEISRAREERLQLEINENREETEKSRKLSVEMDKVVNDMRWVMNVKRNTSLVDDDDGGGGGEGKE
ncbi:hypothetical protein AC578_1394 [Pseudocercospora eumusae]|uniref:Uncharacterized protein n=1 Tax=Pseudocercospora eumusae TaxID=321146 RepID=A0A139HV07_9PEZI|nr:hypothetical protein AC578_1394 [Pseudocercospora eumusae]